MCSSQMYCQKGIHSYIPVCCVCAREILMFLSIFLAHCTRRRAGFSRLFSRRLSPVAPQQTHAHRHTIINCFSLCGRAQRERRSLRSQQLSNTRRRKSLVRVLCKFGRCWFSCGCVREFTADSCKNIPNNMRALQTVSRLRSRRRRRWRTHSSVSSASRAWQFTTNPRLSRAASVLRSVAARPIAVKC